MFLYQHILKGFGHKKDVFLFKKTKLKNYSWILSSNTSIAKFSVLLNAYFLLSSKFKSYVWIITGLKIVLSNHKKRKKKENNNNANSCSAALIIFGTLDKNLLQPPIFIFITGAPHILGILVKNM